KAKFLLTSRRDERAWLKNLPARFQVPPMPMRERAEFAQTLSDRQAQRHGQRLQLADWRPLLRFTQGNPLTLTVVIGQALRENLSDSKAIRDFTARLQSGETGLDDSGEARDSCLAMSLSYGFAQAFDETERSILALLVFFQGFLDVDVLWIMGHPEADWCVPAVRGLSRDSGMALLDRAADIGLLTELGGGYYRIHPALPWYFQRLFRTAYGGENARPARAFVKAMGALGSHYNDQYADGNRGVIANLQAEETNLLAARQRARRQGWWGAVISTMQGLRTLYDHQGRRGEWAERVAEILPDFINPADDGPLPGREEDWSLVTEYRVRLTQENRDYPAAERLQKHHVDWNRQRAAAFLSDPLADGPGHNAVRTLAVSLEQLGHIQRESTQPACVEAYQEALDLYERIEAQAETAVCAFNLGHVYYGVSGHGIPALRDLAQARHWYQHSLDLRGENDRQGQARCLAQLGAVAYERFEDARRAGQKKEAPAQLKAALDYYQQALQCLPATAVNDLAVAHGQLGNIYYEAGELEAALSYYRECIRYHEGAGNFHGAANTQYSIAFALLNADRRSDAREYALAALKNFQRYGTGATQDVEKTQQLLAYIK
ncbi:MAG: hypothetical protein GY862_04370, partial [Gammaproteobacteria bacterium]|nr:hypothetical protein [Gammaproteobacteria bacterium]